MRVLLLFVLLITPPMPWSVNGEVQLRRGLAICVFTPPLDFVPICTATDIDNPQSVTVVISKDRLSFKGSAKDRIAFVCSGRRVRKFSTECRQRNLFSN